MNQWLDIAFNHLQKEKPETSHLSLEEWLKASRQGLQGEIFNEMTGRKDSEIWRTKAHVYKGIPSHRKQVCKEPTYIKDGPIPVFFPLYSLYIEPKGKLFHFEFCLARFLQRGIKKEEDITIICLK